MVADAYYQRQSTSSINYNENMASLSGILILNYNIEETKIKIKSTYTITYLNNLITLQRKIIFKNHR